MGTGKISISGGTVYITTVDGDVWLTQHEITDLFGCFVSKVGSNIRAILKSGILDETKVYRIIRNNNGGYIELYNMEMLTALVFRIHSENADLFRQWLIQELWDIRRLKMCRYSSQLLKGCP